MRRQQDRLEIGITTLPFIQQRMVSDGIQGKRVLNLRIRLFNPCNELYEGCVVRRLVDETETVLNRMASTM